MSKTTCIGKLALASAFVASLGFGLPASASQIFDFTTFAGACGGGQLTCVGSTAAAGTALRVAPAGDYVGGAAYSTSQVSLGAGATFSTTFQFRFTNPGGIDPADGIVFVLADNVNGLGTAGYGIGYAGLQGGSVGIEFDTFNNGTSTNDISSNHVAVDTNGALNNYAAANPYGVADCSFDTVGGSYTYQQTGCMSNGDVWSVTIGYDGTSKLLTVAAQDASNPIDTVINQYSIDIAGDLGASTAYVGFTSATGSGQENHDILNWQLNSDISLAQPPGTPPPTTGVPEPASLALLGIGLLGIVAARRRR